MNKQHLAGRLAAWIKAGLPWVLVMALSTGVAYTLNTGAKRALSTNRSSDPVSTGAQDGSNPCALDVDGALYTRLDWWLPAGRTAFCRAETYPGVPGHNEIANQLTRAGRIQATITFVAPLDVRIDLYCPASGQQRSSDANFVSAAEARQLYEQVCMLAGSSAGG